MKTKLKQTCHVLHFSTNCNQLANYVSISVRFLRALMLIVEN